jgi:hypothetical protein
MISQPSALLPFAAAGSDFCWAGGGDSAGPMGCGGGGCGGGLGGARGLNSERWLELDKSNPCYQTEVGK